MTEALKFSAAEVPDQIFSKPKQENPFEDMVASLAANVDEDGRSAVASTVTVPDDDVKKRVQQLRDAGAAAGVTARKKVESNEDGTSVITFWTTKRIVRPRKPKPDTAAAE